MTNYFRFGTVGSPLSTPKKPGGSVGAILRMKEMGLDALELGWVRAVRVTEETCAAIQACASEQDVKISVHAPYYINLNATDDEWINSRKRLDGCSEVRKPGRGNRHHLSPGFLLW